MPIVTIIYKGFTASPIRGKNIFKHHWLFFEVILNMCSEKSTFRNKIIKNTLDYWFGQLRDIKNLLGMRNAD